MWRYVICLVPTVAIAQVDQGRPNASFDPAFENQTRAPLAATSQIEVSVFASGFDFPWGIAPLSDGGFLVTERGGVLKRVAADGTLVGIVEGLPEVEAIRQGGLLDGAVDADGLVYLTYSKAVDGGVALAGARGVLTDLVLGEVEDIFVQDPPQSSGNHFGSRVVIDEGGVWITSGDRGTPALAQGDLLVSLLRPGGLMRLTLEDGRVTGEERLLPDVGRVRDVEVLADGDLLVLIDARGADILRVSPVE